MRLVKEVRDDPILRRGLCHLAAETFGLAFEPWYQAGGWDDRYRPYIMVEEGQVVACAAATLADYAGSALMRQVSLVQLGTVMTAVPFRGQGLASELIRAILADFSQADGFFLFANDAATGFYSQLGFHPCQETIHWIFPLAAMRTAAAVPLCPDISAMRRMAAWPMRCCAMAPLAQPGLTLFHLMSAGPGCLWHIPGMDAAAVAERAGDTLLLHAVFAPEEVDLARIIDAFGPDFRRIMLGFTPQNGADQALPLREKDTNLFVWGPFFADQTRLSWRFPALCHA